MSIRSRRTRSSIHLLPRPIAISNLRASMTVCRSKPGATPIKPTNCMRPPPESVGPIQPTAATAHYDSPIKPEAQKVKIPSAKPRKKPMAEGSVKVVVPGTGQMLVGMAKKDVAYRQLADGSIVYNPNRDKDKATREGNHSAEK